MADEGIIDGDALGLLAEGGDLDVLGAEEDVHEAKAPSDEPRVAEQVAHLLRMRIGGDVEIFGTPAEHQIAHAAPDQIGELAGLDQPIEHLQHVGVDVATRDGMLGAFEYMRFQSLFVARGSEAVARLPETSTARGRIHDERNQE